MKYAESHEWARDEGDGTVTVGVSDHAQDSLGDVVYVELPEVGATVVAGAEAGCSGISESGHQIFMPPYRVKSFAINEALEDAPETINESPYDAGWFFKIKMSDPL